MYHYNFKTGKVTKCNAKSPESCPFGVDNHAATLEDTLVKADDFNKKIIEFSKKNNMSEQDIKNFIYKDNKRRIDKDKPKQTKINKSKLSAKSELAMMGKYVSIDKENNEEQVNFITNYILKTLDKEDDYKNVNVYKDKINKYGNNIVTHIGVNTIGQDRVVSYVIEPVEKDKYNIPNFSEDYSGEKSAFCYTFNIDFDEYSELGDCFFKLEKDGYYHRKH